MIHGILMITQIPTEVKYTRTYIEITLVGYIYLQLILVYNGQPDYWWLRSPNLNYVNDAFQVVSDGYVDGYFWGVTVSYGRRPALISIRCSSDSCKFYISICLFSFNNSPAVDPNGVINDYSYFMDPMGYINYYFDWKSTVPTG